MVYRFRDRLRILSLDYTGDGTGVIRGLNEIRAAEIVVAGTRR